MSKFRCIIGLFLAVSLNSCINQEKGVSLEPEELLSFDVSTLDNQVHEIKLTDLMESVEIIQMDSVPEAFSKVFKIPISENYFAMHHVNYPVKLYSRKDGKFLGNIGRVGNGPGEYFIIWDVIIEEASNRIYLVDGAHQRKIYAYDFDGNFHEDETILSADGQHFERPYVFFNSDKKQLVIFQTPYEAFKNKYTDLPLTENFCVVQDLSGNLIQRVPSDRYRVPRMDSNVWASHIDSQSPIYQCAIEILFDSRKDTIYHYNIETNELYPVYTSNMYADELTIVSSKETPLHYYTRQKSFQKTILPEFATGYKILQVDKKTGKGQYIRIVNDYLGDIACDTDLWFYFIRGDYVASFWEPMPLKEELEEALEHNDKMSAEVRERVVRLKNSLNENSNNVIMICKFKKQ